MRLSSSLRIVGSAFALGVAILTAACAPAAAPAPAPAPVPQATELFVRNPSNVEVAVYAVPQANAPAVWLANVPANDTRTVSLKWSDLQANGGLVVRTHVVGSSREWQSAPLIIDDGIVAVLTLSLRASNSLAASTLTGYTVQAFNAAVR